MSASDAWVFQANQMVNQLLGLSPGGLPNVTAANIPTPGISPTTVPGFGSTQSDHLQLGATTPFDTMNSSGAVSYPHELISSDPTQMVQSYMGLSGYLNAFMADSVASLQASTTTGKTLNGQPFTVNNSFGLSGFLTGLNGQMSGANAIAKDFTIDPNDRLGASKGTSGDNNSASGGGLTTWSNSTTSGSGLNSPSAPAGGINAVLANAESYKGLHEHSDTIRRVIRKGAQLDPADLAWCAAFVTTMFKESFGGAPWEGAKLQDGSVVNKNLVRSLAQWFKEEDQKPAGQRKAEYFTDPSQLEPGDVFLVVRPNGTGHTGIIKTVRREGGVIKYTTIEGNSSNQVKENTYTAGKHNNLQGFGRVLKP